MRTQSIGHVSPAQESIPQALSLAALERFLSDAQIELLCRQFGHRWRERVLSPGPTIRAMVQRGLAPDRSIRCLLSDLAAGFVGAVAPPTPSAFCQARDRLPAGIWPALIQLSTDRLLRQVGHRHLFHGRPLCVVDGTAVSMPDTPSLVRAFGRAKTKHGPSRFPVARLTLLIRHGVEAIVDYRLGHYRTCEDTHFHQMWDRIPPGSICLWDRRFSSFYNIAKLTARGIDILGRLHQLRNPDRLIRCGRKIGRDEWLVSLPLAAQSHRHYKDPTLPRTLPVRLIRVRFHHGKKPHTIWLITTLLDPIQYPRPELARLYRQRWRIETRIGSLKTTLQLNVLRGKSPASVRSEVAATVLAHNLVWTVIHEAVAPVRIPARRVSFTGAVRTILSFSCALRLAQPHQCPLILQRMLHHIRRQIYRQRPNRIEPRLIKREPVRFAFLRIPRVKARLKCLT